MVYPESQLLVRIKTPSNGSRANLPTNLCRADMAPELLLQAKTVGLKPAGISFHVGSPTQMLIIIFILCKKSGKL